MNTLDVPAIFRYLSKLGTQKVIGKYANETKKIMKNIVFIPNYVWNFTVPNLNAKIEKRSKVT